MKTFVDPELGKYHDWPGNDTVKYVCRWRVISVRNGVVVWSCACGDRMARRVR